MATVIVSRSIPRAERNGYILFCVENGVSEDEGGWDYQKSMNWHHRWINKARDFLSQPELDI